MTEEMKALTLLRNDALRQGMDSLAIVYGWSLIRLGAELIEQRRAV